MTLPKWKMISYSLLRCPISAIDFLIRPARVSLYRDAYGMKIETQAMIISLCKSVDFLLGFGIGYASDNTKTKWGRRKPYIALCFPIFILMMMFLANPPLELKAQRPEVHQLCTDLNSTSCDSLKQCLDTHIYEDTLPNYDHDLVYAGTTLSVYFACAYFLYYAFGWTSTVIPYDALGMELTDDFNERSTLFGIKTSCQFIGYVLQIILGLIFTTLYATDVTLQIKYPSFILAGFGLVSQFVLLMTIKERQPPHSNRFLIEEKPVVPIVPTVRKMFNNKPYFTYLAMRIPMTLASLMPTNLALDYLKYVAQIENANQMYQIVMLIALVSCFLCIPLLVKLSQKYGKKEVLYKICILQGCVFFISTFFPSQWVAYGLIYPIAMFMGAGQAASFIIPDSMLADIIDYAELQTTERNEGMYTVIESNVQQFVEIVGGVLPSILFYAVGFQNNGGCSCGCGVKCEQSVTRWVCPNDVGYACSSDFDNPLFYGKSDRKAPCTIQNEETQLMIRLFFMALPGLMFLLSAYPAYKMRITKPIHDEILAQIEYRKKHSMRAFDPLTQKTVKPPGYTRKHLFLQHFSTSELQGAEKHTEGVIKYLFIRISGMLCAYITLFGCLIGLMVGTQGNQIAVTFCSLVCALLFVLIPWEYKRLRYLMDHWMDAPHDLIYPPHPQS